MNTRKSVSFKLILPRFIKGQYCWGFYNHELKWLYLAQGMAISGLKISIFFTKDFLKKSTIEYRKFLTTKKQEIK